MFLDLFLACSDGPAERDTWSAADEHYDCTPVDQYSSGGKSAPSGYEYCAVDGTAGFMHRVKAVDVADDFWDADAICSDEAFPNEDCKTDADCGKGGVCETSEARGCHCVPKCRTDADCGQGKACLPRMLSLGGSERVLSGDNYCIDATCLTDAECPSGWCVLSSGCSAPIGGQLHCFTDKDECRTSGDCADAKECYFGLDERFECNYNGSCE
jgi:hypothetical protein